MKKILIPIVLCGFLIGCDNGENSVEKSTQVGKKQQTNSDASRYRELVDLYVGKTVPYSQYELIGSPETISGTNNSQWVAYFPKGNFTIVTDKKTDMIRTVYVGKREF